MKRVQHHSYGGPQVMRLEAFTLPAPGPGQIAVRVKAASINPFDWKARQGAAKMMTGRVFPRGMGTDFSGIIEAVGPGVTRFKPGDEVFGVAPMKQNGSFAEKLITEEKLAAVKPAALGFAQAACLPVVAVTAWRGLVDKARLKAGQRVFVSGCTGGVGQAAVQIARMMGASVAGSCSASALTQARALGVDPTVDYANGKLSSLEKSVDVVFETSGRMSVGAARCLLRPGGVILDINPNPGKFLSALFGGPLKIVLSAVTSETLETIGKAAAEGKIKMTIGKTVPLDGAITLIADLEQGQKIGGKGVILMD